jgi:hypothetical protein
MFISYVLCNLILFTQSRYTHRRPSLYSLFMCATTLTLLILLYPLLLLLLITYHSYSHILSLLPSLLLSYLPSQLPALSSPSQYCSGTLFNNLVFPCRNTLSLVVCFLALADLMSISFGLMVCRAGSDCDSNGLHWSSSWHGHVAPLFDKCL